MINPKCNGKAASLDVARGAASDGNAPHTYDGQATPLCVHSMSRMAPAAV